MDQVVKDKMSEIDRGANAMQRNLEKRHIRKMQKSAYLCGSRCCDDVNTSAEEVQRCVENCQRPLVQMQSAVKQELERFQSRIERCMMNCQDQAQDSIKSMGEALTKTKFQTCLCSCADEHLKLLPEVEKRLIEAIPK